MNTQEFFRAILPDEGVYYLALIDRKTGRVTHKAYTDFAEMAEGAAAFDEGDKYSVYHACAAYKEPFIEVEGQKKYRTPENWLGAKSLWIDLDCGAEKAAKGEGYATKRDACIAIYAFCDEYLFPRPMVVDSGNGVHCYWPLTKTIKPETWRPLAAAFKRILTAANVLADPTCTADLSRILRPVGTHNKKGEAKQVVCKVEIKPIDPQQIADRLKALVTTFGIKPDAPKKSIDVNDDLTAHLPPQIPSYAEIAANHCAQMAQMRDTQGDVSYDHWHKVIGVIFHSEEGIELAHKWSARREETGHSQTDVDTRYNTWNAGPTTCSKFSEINPKGCEGCPHKGKITSPIELGRKPEESEERVEEVIVEGKKMEVEIPKFPPNYKYEQGQMIRFMQDKDGIWHSFPFSYTHFYPIYRLRKENGEFNIGIRQHLPDFRIRDFEIETSVLAADIDAVRALAKFDVYKTNNKDAPMHLSAYLRDSVEKLKKEAEELSTMTSFGWKDDMQSFLIGDRLYHRDGTIRKVLVGGYASDKVDAFPLPRGRMENYAKALNYVYNRPGMEPMQYAICSGFGSILTPLGENLYKGLLVAITGSKSGKGKTTACYASLYAFGDADKMALKSEKGSTPKARWARMGTYQNLPVLFDELTNIKIPELSDLAFYASMGEEPERLTTGKGAGIRFADRFTWRMNAFITGNTDFHAALSVHQSNTQSEAVRFIQIRVDDYDIPMLDESEVAAALRQMDLNQGTAGEAYIQYVVKNLDDVIEIFQKNVHAVAQEIPGSEYRFYRNHAACTLTAAEVLHKLGVVQFNLKNLFQYSIDLMKAMCANVAQNNVTDSEDAFNTMINDLNPRIIVTNEYRDGRDARGPEQINRIIEAPAGRFIRGGGSTKSPLAGRLYLVIKDVRKWCLDNRSSMGDIIKFARDHNILVSESEKFTIGRGTPVATSNMRCIVFDLNKLAEMADKAPTLTLHTGGKAGTDSEDAVSSNG